MDVNHVLDFKMTLEKICMMKNNSAPYDYSALGRNFH